MSESFSFVARQPILNEKKETYAYELLFRQGLTNVFPQISSEKATTTLLAEQFLSQPIESLVGDKISFINFPYSLILDGIISTLPKDTVVIEILEDATPNQELLKSVKQLKDDGYKLALDDFTLEPEWDKFLPFVDIIKFDWRLTSHDDIKNYISGHEELLGHIRLLAEKIETQEEFEDAKSLGFTLFQGYFFSKPEVIKQKTLSSNQLTLTQMLSETVKEEVDFNKIADIMMRDHALAYKMLRYVNNINYGGNEIKNFQHALSFLGKDNIRRFISLVYATSIGQGKPDELSRLSLVRAKFCEMIAEKRKRYDPQDAFFCGLFSLLDAMMDKPIGEIIAEIPIKQEIKDAILKKSGELAFYLGLVKDYESLYWERVYKRIAQMGMKDQDVIDIYTKATQWTQQVLNG